MWYFDIGQRAFVRASGSEQLMNQVPGRRGDSIPISVRIQSGTAAVTLTDVTEMVFVVKSSVLDGVTLMLANDWTEDDGVWRAQLAMDTEELETAMDGQERADFFAEFTFTSSLGRITSQLLSFPVTADLWLGIEGTPLSLPTPEEWLQAQGVAYIQRLTYDPLDADQDGVTVSGTLGHDGSPFTTPFFLPEIGVESYRYIAPDMSVYWGVYGGSTWQLVDLISGADWDNATPIISNPYTPSGDTTGTATIALATRPKTTGDFCVVDDGIRTAALWVNDGDDTTPAWRPVREGYKNATHASGTLTLTAANAGTSRITTSTGASAFSIVPTADLAYDPNNALVWIITQGGAGVGTVDATGLTVSYASGAGLKTPGQNESMILRQTGFNIFLLSGGAA